MLDFQPAPTAAPAPPATFTYSHAGQSRFRRGLIRAVERISGQPKLRSLYQDWATSGRNPDESVFAAALRLLNLRPRLSGPVTLDSLPKTGGLLLVANHPYGIIDGLMMGHLGMALRGNVAIMTNSLLCQVPEITPHLLPVDFSGTPAARRLTADTRRKATDLLAMGKVVALFPAGGVATANGPLRPRAVDAAWHPFVGRLATLPGVTTVPVFFSGQNSRLFQAASHFSYPMRVALIFHETRRRMGRALDVTIGTPIASDDLKTLDKSAIADHLRRRTIGLCPDQSTNPDEVFIWPARVKW